MMKAFSGANEHFAQKAGLKGFMLTGKFVLLLLLWYINDYVTIMVQICMMLMTTPILIRLAKHAGEQDHRVVCPPCSQTTNSAVGICAGSWMRWMSTVHLQNATPASGPFPRSMTTGMKRR